MLRKERAERIIRRYGRDILNSDGMHIEKNCLQHGQISVYEHSYMVAVLCVELAIMCRIRADMRALVRGALLHDYFLYDWHEKDKSHRLHGFIHAERALKNAESDFRLTDIERNMIRAHMFPLNLVLPRYRESVLLCVADKICATRETVAGMMSTFN